MKSFLRLWLVLSTALVIATLGSSILLFRHLDFSYEYFCQLVTIPICQALLVSWATRQPSRISIAQAARETVGRPLALPVIVMDAVLLPLAWLLPAHHIIGIGGAASLVPAWSGTKAVAGSLFLLPAARTPGWSTGRDGHEGATFSTPERVWLVAFALGGLAIGIDAFQPWLHALPQVLVPTLPTVLRWLLVYGGLFATATWVALRVSEIAARRSPVAGAYFSGAIAAAWVAAVITVLNVFVRRYPLQPWAGLIRTSMSIATTFLLLGAMFTAGVGRGVLVRTDRDGVDNSIRPVS